jgi:hypothetical protein
MYRLIASSASSDRIEQDGLYKNTERNQYLFTCVHGSDTGHLTLQWKNEFYNFQPYQFRKLIKTVIGITINNNSKIKICPCYPRRVNNRYYSELKKANLEVISNLDSSVHNRFEFREKEFQKEKLVIRISVSNSIEEIWLK